ncbi:adenylate/guanylate cyclase domain-containing protein [Mesorhizobium shangrilense]|uniref:Adenylate/guanylate cyclase domain-containing protein n=1 Tax=Mesorhizobium shangrilense TaxID=460060 RepID=A0ABV2DLK0_9HYPH
MARPERKLVAVLAADVAGYSCLMGADEAGTLFQLKALRAEVIDPKVAQFRGRLVGTAGDSLLIEFPSAVDALQFAVETQERITARNTDLPEDRRMAFRMGVNAGEVILDETTIYGDCVKVAAWLEKVSEPGGVVIGRSVYDQVKGKIPYTLVDLGEHAMKNIAGPVRAYRVLTSDMGRKAVVPLFAGSVRLAAVRQDRDVARDHVRGDRLKGRPTCRTWQCRLHGACASRRRAGEVGPRPAPRPFGRVQL